MKAKRIIGAVGVAVAMMSALLWMARRESEPALSAPSAAPSSTKLTVAVTTQDTVPALKGRSAALQGSGEPGIAGRFRAASDYRRFIADTLPLAESGNSEAQFYIAMAMRFCRQEHRAYFWNFREHRYRTREEAIQYAKATFGFSMEDADDVFVKCDALMRSDRTAFGDEDIWLALSAEGGHPLAQVTYAQMLMMPRAAPRGDGHDGMTLRQAGRAEALRHLHAAVRSRSPQVLWEIGMTKWSPGIELEEDEEIRRWGWLLLACRRGADCSPQAQWTRMACRFDPHCQPDHSAVELIMRMTGSDFPRVELAARELGERLEAGQWDQLGLPQY